MPGVIVGGCGHTLPMVFLREKHRFAERRLETAERRRDRWPAEVRRRYRASTSPTAVAHTMQTLSSAPLVVVRGVGKTYPTPAGIFTALDDVSFTLDRGDFAVIAGQSGSGKSTMLGLL